MSRVTITDLVPGTPATSADVNATINSWNTAGAVGAIGANNVRDEGIDRRTLSAAAQAIQAAPAAYGDCLVSSSANSGAVGPTAVYTVITLGGTDLRIGPMTDLSSSSSETVIVRGSVWFAAAQGSTVECILQSATVLGGPWTSYDETYQAFLAPNYIAGCVWRCLGTYTSVLATTPAGSRVYWRIAYKVGAATVTFYNGTLYIEEYSR